MRRRGRRRRTFQRSASKFEAEGCTSWAAACVSGETTGLGRSGQFLLRTLDFQLMQWHKTIRVKLMLSRIRRCDIFPSALLILSILLSGVGLPFIVAFLNDVQLGLPLWSGILFVPCIWALQASLFIALFGLGFYVAQRQPRDLITLSISAVSLLVMSISLLLWMSYQFPNNLPGP